MSLCILTAGKTLVLAVSSFTLTWTHSVEKVEWRESYTVAGSHLLLKQAAVQGSGAGMEPGAEAVLRDGWWVWEPKLSPLPSLVLAASGTTPGGWRLCHAGGCITLGAEAGRAVTLKPCQ